LIGEIEVSKDLIGGTLNDTGWSAFRGLQDVGRRWRVDCVLAQLIYSLVDQDGKAQKSSCLLSCSYHPNRLHWPRLVLIDDHRTHTAIRTRIPHISRATPVETSFYSGCAAWRDVRRVPWRAESGRWPSATDAYRSSDHIMHREPCGQHGSAVSSHRGPCWGCEYPSCRLKPAASLPRVILPGGLLCARACGAGLTNNVLRGQAQVCRQAAWGCGWLGVWTGVRWLGGKAVGSPLLHTHKLATSQSVCEEREVAGALWRPGSPNPNPLPLPQGSSSTHT
jgi:hypothetical protein